MIRVAYVSSFYITSSPRFNGVNREHGKARRERTTDDNVSGQKYTLVAGGWQTPV